MGKDTTQEENGEEREKGKVDSNHFSHMGKGMGKREVSRVTRKEVEKETDPERQEMGDQYSMGHVTNVVCLDTHKEDVHHWERDLKGNAMDAGE